MADKAKSNKLKSRNSNEDNQKKSKKAKTDKDEEIDEKTADVFNRDWLLNENDKCALCKGNHEDGIKLNKIIVSNSVIDEHIDEFKKNFDPEGISDINQIWASKYSLVHKTRRLFCHYNCALSSPQVYFEKMNWSGLKKEIDRGSRLTCTTCGMKGATLGCIDKRCNVNMHIPCAVRSGFRVSGFKFEYYCDKHVEEMRLKDIEADKQVKGDISNSHEPIPITISNSSDISRIMKEFHYTKINLDSNDVIVNTRSVQTDCCNCEGLCDNVATCECLAAFGRNYTFTGSLIPGTNRRILECNLRCSCSIRRCTNRVVEKGPTSRLQVFRPSNTTTTESSSSSSNAGSSSSSNTGSSSSSLHPVWGVRTLDFIPEGQFVCEVAGQYVLGRSGEANTTGAGSSTGADSNNMNDAAKSVVDLILQDPSMRPLSEVAAVGAGSGASELPYTARIIPVGAWEEAGPGDAGAFDPLTWAAKEAAAADMNTGNSSLNDPSTTAAVVVDRLTEEHYDSIRNFLRGEICIDSRKFGNIGSLIRRLPPPSRSSSSGGSGSSATDTTATSNNSSSSNNIDDNNSSSVSTVERMLLRRLVFTNKSKAQQKVGLKLALFAARNIPAGSELFI